MQKMNDCKIKTNTENLQEMERKKAQNHRFCEKIDLIQNRNVPNPSGTQKQKDQKRNQAHEKQPQQNHQEIHYPRRGLGIRKEQDPEMRRKTQIHSV
ncbi:MAG: hypothetical protein J6M34_02395 [Clostridia bacterium]|nr:hypothetical protein [Clostridia bacterium]